MRLIDADALMKWANDHYDFEVYTVGYISDLIKDSPTVDAVPVIRCKDCKCHYESKCENWEYISTDDDYFCKDGERKEE